MTSRRSRKYLLFGGTLESDLDFPELQQGGSDPSDWILKSDKGPAPPGGLKEMGSSGGSVLHRLFNPDGEWQFQFFDTGVFRVAQDGSQIVWYQGDNEGDLLVRSVVLGPVMALCLEAAGFTVLHGSAVSIAGKGVGFLGPKHHGKSSLALALTMAGAKLATDDSLAVTCDKAPAICPGVQNLRLWDDAIEQFKSRMPGHVVRGHKNTITGIREGSLLGGRVPLDCIYLLRPCPPETPVSRRLLPRSEALVRLAQNSKLPDCLVGLPAAADRMQRLAALMGQVPVFELNFAFDYRKIGALAGQVLRWHTDDSPIWKGPPHEPGGSLRAQDPR